MRCPNCGKEGAVNFCAHCGTSVLPDPSTFVQKQTGNQQISRPITLDHDELLDLSKDLAIDIDVDGLMAEMQSGTFDIDIDLDDLYEKPATVSGEQRLAALSEESLVLLDGTPVDSPQQTQRPAFSPPEPPTTDRSTVPDREPILQTCTPITLAVSVGRLLFAQHKINSPQVVIGRDSSTDIVINSLSVSRRHCQIYFRGSQVLLRDLGTTNGTLVNGKLVRETPLRHGDIIGVGKFFVIYCPTSTQLAKLRSAPRAPAHPTSSGSVARTEVLSSHALREVRRRLEEDRGAYLELTEVQEGAKKRFFLQRTSTVVGSSDSADIVLPGLFVKKKHAIITRDQGGYAVECCGGGRIQVNGQAVKSSRLDDGDRIKIGSHHFQFFDQLK